MGVRANLAWVFDSVAGVMFGIRTALLQSEQLDKQ